MIRIICETDEEKRRIKSRLTMFGACKLTCNCVLPCYRCERGNMKVSIEVRQQYIGGISDVWNTKKT